MKIGILSLYRTLILEGNYGTLFQNYALQAHLQSKGHTTHWVRTVSYRPKPSSNIASAGLAAIRFHGQALMPWFGMRLPGISLSPHSRPYQAFLRKYVSFSQVEYSADDLLSRPPQADAWIIGSDQVWNSRSSIMFLDFVPPGVRRIAYAVSANWRRLPETWAGEFGAAIMRMDAVSVREREGLALCEKAGREDTVQVLDPALLLLKEDYLRLIEAEGNGRSPAAPFLFAYYVGADEALEATHAQVRAVADCSRLGLQADSLPRRDRASPCDTFSNMNPTPTEWLNAFNTCSSVITNSFHGVVFSVLFERPFLVILRSSDDKPAHQRILNLLSSLKLENRAITQMEFERKNADDIRLLLDSLIQWSAVGIELGRLRAKSAGFLEAALGSPS